MCDGPSGDTSRCDGLILIAFAVSFVVFDIKIFLELIELICLYLGRFRLVLTTNLVDVRFSSILNLVMPSMIFVMLILAHSKIEIFHLLMPACALS